MDAFSLEAGQWWPLVLCALLIGMNKAGLRGLNAVVVPVFAAIFGGRTSAAIVLPLLITGDICAIIIYRKTVAFGPLLKLLPATLAGLLAGMFLGRFIPDRVFLLVMAGILLICLILMSYREFAHRDVELPDHWAAHSAAGLLGGFATMIGNAAGPVMAVYLMAMNMKKKVFIGTGAVFFFVVNLIKVPIHLAFWASMDASTLAVSLPLTPLVVLGIGLGFLVVNRIPEKPYRLLVLAATLVATVSMLV